MKLPVGAAAFDAARERHGVVAALKRTHIRSRRRVQAALQAPIRGIKFLERDVAKTSRAPHVVPPIVL